MKNNLIWLFYLLFIVTQFACDQDKNKDSLVTSTETPSSATGNAFGNISYSASLDEEGHAVVEIPLDIVPAGNKFQPKLSFIYSSSGSGSLSSITRGWSLSGLLVVSRCTKTLTDDGSYAGIDFSSGDRFCFEGKRLKLQAGQYGQDGSEYRTDPDEFHKFVFHKGSGPGYFEVFLKSGEIAEIGNVSNAAELNASGTEAFLWSVSSIEDRSGNRIDFAYRKSDIGSLPQLREVTYGGNRATAVAFNRRILIDWRDKPVPLRWKYGASSTAVDAVPSRIQLFSRDQLVASYEPSYSRRASSYVEDITGVTKCFPSGSCLPKTKIDYEGSSIPSFVEQPMTNGEVAYDSSTDFDSQKTYRYFDDFNGDGFKDFITINKKGLAYLATGSSSGFGAASAVSFDSTFFNSMNKSSRGDPMFLLDIDSDGFPDLVLLSFSVPNAQQGIYAAKGDGRGFSSFVKMGETAIKWDIVRHIPAIVDMDSDGLPDIAFYHEDGVVWYRNTAGTGFAYMGLAAKDFSIKTGWGNALHPKYFADINGDGYPDIVGFHDLGVKVAYGNGSTFGPTKDILAEFGNKSGYTIAGTPRLLADVNGDGIPDIVAFANEGVRVAIGTGAGFLSSVLWLSDLGFNQGWGAAIKGQRLMSDVNGDGLPDFIGISTSGLTVYLNTGSPYTSATAASAKIQQPVNLSTWSPNAYFALPYDANGDGTEDMGIMLRAGLWSLNTTISDIQVKTVEDAYQNKSTFDYISQNNTAVYTNSSKKPAFPRLKFTGTRKLASKITFEAVGLLPRTITQRYEDGIFHLQGHGFLGFRKVVSEDNASKIVTEKVRSDGSDGNPEGAQLLTSTFLRKPTGLKQLGQVASIWKKVPGSGPQAAFWYPNHIETTTWSPESDQVISTAVRDEAYDSFGNMTSSQNTLTDSFGSSSIKTINRFDDVPSRWQLARLGRTEVTSSEIPADGSPSTSLTKVSEFHYDTDGLLTTSVIEPGTQYEQTEIYGRFKNRFGHIDTITQTWVNPEFPAWAEGAESSLKVNAIVAADREYDDLGFLHIERNALDQPKITVTDERFGSPLSTTDANGVSESASYREEGIIDFTIDKDGRKTEINYFWCDSKCPASAVYFVKSAKNQQGEVVSYFNGKSQEVRRMTQGFEGRWTILDKEFDLFGNAVRISRPYFQDRKVLWDLSRFDDLQRIVRVEKADGSVSTRTYNGNTIIETDPDNRTTSKIIDSKGRIRRVINSKQEALVNSYDADGHVILITNPRGISVAYAFDRLGRKISESDPDRGVTEFVYNGLNLPAATRDSLDQVTILEYDKLKRLVKRRKSTGSVDFFTYDQGAYALGLLSSSSNGLVSESLGYSKEGRIVSHNVSYSGDIPQSFEMHYDYDKLGRLARQRWPNGTAVQMGYDDYGTQVSFTDIQTGKTLWQATKLTPSATVEEEKLGNGLIVSISRDQRNDRIQGISSSKASGFVVGETYDYTPAGDVRLRTDTGSGSSEAFEYDPLHRLKYVRDRQGLIQEELDYDDLGNIIKKRDVPEYKYNTTACSGMAPAPLHSPSQIGDQTLCYDAKGQLISDGTRSFSFNFEGQPLRVKTKDSTVSYRYDATGRLVLQGLNRVTREISTFLPFEGFELEKNGSITKSKVIIAGRVLLESTQGITIDKYLHSDRLGSIVAVSDSSGNLMEKLAYDSFGKRINRDSRIPVNGYSPVNVSEGFTGQRHSDTQGLIHMKGRLYDPYRGQFVTADPFVQQALNLQSLNRYMYVMGNPLTMADPSGFFGIGDVFKGIGDAFDGIGGALTRLGRWLSRDQNQRLIASIAILAVTAWYTAPYTIASWQLYAYSAVGGAMAAAITSKGSLDAVARGSLTAMVFSAVGSYCKTLTGDYAKLVAPIANGLTSGVATVAQGGKFQTGFMVGAISSGLAVGGAFKALGMVQVPKEFWDFAYNAVMAGVIGGAISQVAGGTFENGATTAAFQRIFGDIMTNMAQPEKRPLNNKEKLWSQIKAAANGLVGDIDESLVRIAKKYLPFQLSSVAITPDNTIYYPGDTGDMTKTYVKELLLVHELVHIWQNQSGINVLLQAAPLQILYWGSFKLIDIYATPQGITFQNMTVEQQAEHIVDLYAAKYYPDVVRIKQ